MNPLVSILASATFFINSENRAFMRKHIYAPVGHGVVKIERVVKKPFRKKP